MFTCRFYKVFGRYLLCCVRIGLDWIQILGHQLDWTGLGSVAHGFGLDWIVSTQSIPYSDHSDAIDGRLFQKWDDKLAEIAQAHVEKCQLGRELTRDCINCRRTGELKTCMQKTRRGYLYVCHF